MTGMEKIIETYCRDKHASKDDSRTSKKRSSLSSSKVGAARVNDKDKLAGGQLGKFQQSNLTQVSKLQSVQPVTKRKFQKTSEAGPKIVSVYNLRSKDPIIEAAKDSQGYNLRSKVRKIEDQNASTKKTPKKDGSIHKGFQKTELQKSHFLKSSEPPINKVLSTSLVSFDKKEQRLISPFELCFSEPMYHIRWEGDDTEIRPIGQKCTICNKDLSGVTEDEDSEHNDALQYDEDDDDDDDELDYYDDLNPPLLPAVDVLVCGHAFHTECLQKLTPEDRSSDPECTVCSKMA